MRVRTGALDRGAAGVRVAILLCAVAWCGCGESSVAVPEPPSPSEGLVFVRSEAGGRDLFQARLSDGAVRRLLESPDLIESDPAWSAAVLRVVYRAELARDRRAPARLMMTDPIDGQTVPADERAALDHRGASVSRDGRRIAYVFEAPPGAKPPRGVHLLSAMTGQSVALPVGAVAPAYFDPSFSPAGDAVAIQVRVRRRGDQVWLLTESEATSLVDVPRFAHRRPRFDAAGTSVYFSRSPHGRARRGRQSAALGGGDICRVELTTREVDCVVESEDARETWIEPSPTRDELVFVRQRDGKTDLFLATGAGTEERRLTDSPDREERSPSWSPDGERIAYADGPPSQERVVVIDREGRVVFETPGSQPGWAPPFGD